MAREFHTNGQQVFDDKGKEVTYKGRIVKQWGSDPRRYSDSNGREIKELKGVALQRLGEHVD